MRLIHRLKKMAGRPSKIIQSSAEQGNKRPGVVGGMTNLVTFLIRWLNNIGMGFIALLMILITIDVLLRWIANRPIKGVNELAELTMLLVVFLTIGYTQLTKSNVSVDLLFTRFPQRMQLVVDAFNYLLSLGISALMLRQAIIYTSYLADINRQSVILKIPVAPFQFAMIIGFAMLSIVLLFQMIDAVRKAVKR
ncbi:MAG: TRAP transporter small permease [Dehalococcoidales bacterium]|nr:TRAP transporter small permease [Dehalococcoidales bacterium]